MKKYSVVDIGSNSVRMTVYAPNGNRPCAIKNIRQYVRLSEGMEKDNLLKKPAIERTVSALCKMKRAANAAGAEKIYCIATEAVRRADNAAEFLQAAKDVAGLHIRVLSGTEEAEIGFLAVAGDMDDGENIIIDVGGGSAEITLVKDKRIVGSVSLRLGAVVLTERFLDKPPEAIYGYVYNELKAIAFLDGVKNAPVTALGGTASTASRVFNEEKLSKNQIDSLYERLCALPPSARHEICGIEREREDIILAGVTVFKALLDITCGETFRFSESNIRDGLAKKIYDGRYK